MSTAGVVQSPHALSGYAPLGLALVTLSGLPFLFVAYWPVLWRRRRRPPFVWLAGAHPEFLAWLPRWQPGPFRDRGKTTSVFATCRVTISSPNRTGSRLREPCYRGGFVRSFQEDPCELVSQVNVFDSQNSGRKKRAVSWDS
jgi:hypothetical protein